MYGSRHGRLRRSRHFPCERRQMSNEETSVSVRRSNDQVAMFARRAKITLRDAGRRDGPRGATRDENLSGDILRACNKRYKVAYKKDYNYNAIFRKLGRQAFVVSDEAIEFGSSVTLCALLS